MKKFIIERDLPGAGKLTSEELNAIAIKSCNAIDSLKTQYHWIQTYVTDNKLYCVHIAPDRDLILEHARQGGFPVDKILEIKTVIDPTTSVI